MEDCGHKTALPLKMMLGPSFPKSDAFNKMTSPSSHLGPLRPRTAREARRPYAELKETPETPPSSRAEGLLFLHGLESNPGSSLQTEEGAGDSAEPRPRGCSGLGEPRPALPSF